MNWRFYKLSLLLLLSISSVQVYGAKKDEDEDCNPKIKKEPCDENAIMMHLARLPVSSPEQIVLLLTTGCPLDTCDDVSDVLSHIEDGMANCIPLPTSNLYIRLRNGLVYFYSTMCEDKDRRKRECDDLSTYLECLKELRDDYIDCEGPADWYERKNISVVCQHYQDVLNCYYVRTALLCGLRPARLVHNFMVNVFQHVVPIRCPKPRMPKVQNPMIADAVALKPNRFLYYFAVILIFIFTYYYNHIFSFK